MEEILLPMRRPEVERQEDPEGRNLGCGRWSTAEKKKKKKNPDAIPESSEIDQSDPTWKMSNAVDPAGEGAFDSGLKMTWASLTAYYRPSAYRSKRCKVGRF